MNEERGLPRRLTRVETRARTREQLLDAAASSLPGKVLLGRRSRRSPSRPAIRPGPFTPTSKAKSSCSWSCSRPGGRGGIARRTTAIAEILNEEIADDADPLDALTRMFVRFADRDSELAPLQAEFWLYAVRNPEAMGVMAEKLEEQLVALERLVAPRWSASELLQQSLRER